LRPRGGGEMAEILGLGVPHRSVDDVQPVRSAPRRRVRRRAPSMDVLSPQAHIGSVALAASDGLPDEAGPMPAITIARCGPIATLYSSVTRVARSAQSGWSRSPTSRSNSSSGATSSSSAGRAAWHFLGSAAENSRSSAPRRFQPFARPRSKPAIPFKSGCSPVVKSMLEHSPTGDRPPKYGNSIPRCPFRTPAAQP
jgi:hypothetical protein